MYAEYLLLKASDALERICFIVDFAKTSIRGVE
jgi:hypothetical protein